MASIIRRKVSHQVMSSIKSYLSRTEWAEINTRLPRFLTLSKNNKNHPQYLLRWKELINLKPDLENHVHPETVLTYLKNQEFPADGCVTGVHFKDSKVPIYAFDVDSNVFNQGVIFELCNSIDNLRHHSSFFNSLPKTNVIVEYSSPNIAKPFHYGHLRSTILGNFIGNINEFFGHKVTRLNYLGDWGLQYGILATGFQEFGSPEKLQEDPLQHLYEVYKEANIKNDEDHVFNSTAREHFRKMEEGNEDVLQEWKKLRDLSIAAMNETYERLGVRFDEVHSESMYASEVKAVLKELVEKKVIQPEDEGLLSMVVTCGKSAEEEKVILQKSDGTSLYLSRDVAAAIDRKEKYNFDTMYYVVDSSQSKHFRHLCEIVKRMGHYWSSDIHHVSFGRITKFSTRKGTAVFLHEILNEAQERTLERMKNSPNTKVHEGMDKVADILGISSLIINDMNTARKSNFDFDWNRVLKMDGNSGVTLQYCHARLTGIKENCGVELDLRADVSLLTEPEACDLIHMMAKFDEVLYRSYVNLEPYLLVLYLFKLKSAIGRANKVLTVKDQNEYVAKARLLLFHTAQNVLRKGLEILGITPLDHM